MNLSSNILFLYLLFACNFDHNAAMQDESRKQQSIPDKKGVDEVTLAWERWHTDSKGCMNLRKWEDGILLINRYKLDNNLRDSVVKVLGQPNHIHRGLYTTEEYEEINAVEYSYYFHTWCQGDTLRPESFLTLVFSTETDRVVEKRGGVH